MDKPSSSGRTNNVSDIIRNFNGFKSVYNSMIKGKLRVIETLNPEQQLQKARQKRAELLPAEQLYSHRILRNENKVYQHYSEEAILCVGNQQVNLDFITPDSKRKLRASGFSTIHLGAVLIGIYGQHREHLGSKVLISLLDTRFSDLRKAVVGQIEVDLHNNYELVYIIPKDFQLSLNDFCNFVKIIIKTKGYESMTQGESNLLIVKALTARVSNYIASTVKIETEHIAQFLGSQGIKAIPGKVFDPNELNGQEWNIELPQQVNPSVPQRALNWMNKDNSLSTRFTHYQDRQTNDDSEDEQEFAMVIIDHTEEQEISWEEFLYENPEYYIYDEYIETPEDDQQHRPIYDTDNEENFINPWSQTETSEYAGSVVGKKENEEEKIQRHRNLFEFEERLKIL